MNNDVEKKSKRGRMIKIIGCILLAIILMKLGGCSLFGDKGKEVQKGMTAYLKQRYGMEFEVEKPYVTGDYSLAHYQAKAHPKGEKQPEFLVNDDSSLKEAGFNGKFNDNYSNKKWDYQGKMEIQKKINEIYGGEIDYDVRYHFGGGGEAFKDLDFAQVFESSKGRSINSHSSIKYKVFMDGAQFNKEEEAQKAYKIIKPFILDLSDNYTISVVFIDKADKQDYLKNPIPYDKKSMNDDYPGNKDKKILGHFWLRSLTEKPLIINSGSDILKLSEYINGGR